MGFGGGFKGGSGKVGTDQEVSGTIHISEEQASTPDAPTDSGGILYVKSGDPTKVYYRGKGGSEVDLTETGVGGGGGGGIALNPQGSENQLLTRHANTMTASAEANLTFDGDTNVLTVTGQVTASVGLSGAAGQFTTLKVGGQDVVGYYATGSNVDTNTANIATITAAYATGSDVDTNTANIATITAAYATGSDVDTNTTNIATNAAAFHSRLALTGGTLTGHLTGTVVAAQELYTHEGAWPYLKLSGSEISATGSGGQNMVLRPKGWDGMSGGPGVVSIGDAGMFIASEIWTSSSFVHPGFGQDIGNSTYFRIHHGGETPAHTIELTSSDGGHAHFDIKAHGNEVVAIRKLKLSGAAEGNSQNFTGLGTLSASVLQGGGAGIEQLQAGNIVGTVGSATNATNVDVKNDNTDNANHYVTYVDNNSGDQRVSANAGLLFHPRFMNNTNNKLLTITGEHAELRLESSDASKRTRLIMSSSAHQWMFDADGSTAGPGNPDALVLYHSKSSGQADRLYVSASGEIGIGTTTPTRGKLDVNGAVAANSIVLSQVTASGFAVSSSTEWWQPGSLVRIGDVAASLRDNEYAIFSDEQTVGADGQTYRILNLKGRNPSEAAINIQKHFTGLTASVGMSGSSIQFGDGGLISDGGSISLGMSGSSMTNGEGAPIKFTNATGSGFFPFDWGSNIVGPGMEGKTVDFGSVKLRSFQFKSDIGTAGMDHGQPIIVNSITKVDNLNADLLDGQEGTHYLNRANHTGVLSTTQVTGTVAVSGALGSFTTITASYISASHIQATDMTLASDSLTIGSTTLNEDEMAYLDGVSAGTAAADKALVLNSAGRITTGLTSITATRFEFDELMIDGAEMALQQNTLEQTELLDGLGTSRNNEQDSHPDGAWAGNVENAPPLTSSNGSWIMYHTWSTGDGVSTQGLEQYSSNPSHDQPWLKMFSSGKLYIGAHGGINTTSNSYLYDSMNIKLRHTMANMNKTATWIGGRKLTFTYTIQDKFENWSQSNSGILGDFKLSTDFGTYGADNKLPFTVGTHTVTITARDDANPEDFEFTIGPIESANPFQTGGTSPRVLRTGCVIKDLSLKQTVLDFIATTSSFTGSLNLATNADSKVGVGTTVPQHALDVPDMGGLILAYKQFTGSADGQGNEVVFAFKADRSPGKLPAEDGVSSDSFFGVPRDAGFSPILDDNGGGLSLTFTLPASGRALISVPSGIWRAADKDAFTKTDNTSEFGWVPSDSVVASALTRSGDTGLNPAGDFNDMRQGAIYASLSSTSPSYTCLGPKNEFHIQVGRVLAGRTSGGHTQAGDVQPLNMPEWVVTGSPGQSFTAYLAMGAITNASDACFVGVWGGTGSLDADSRSAHSPSYGPICMKVVSLPSES